MGEKGYTDIEVIQLVLKQIGELRVPIQEIALHDGLVTIAGNLQALLDAMNKRDEPETEEAEPEVGEDVHR